MTSKRTIEAYDRRLAAMTDIADLQTRDLGAIITVSSYQWDGNPSGVLTSFTHRIGQGLFGPTVYTDVKVCPACVDGPSHECEEQEVAFASLVSIRRNEAKR